MLSSYFGKDSTCQKESFPPSSPAHSLEIDPPSRPGNTNSSK
jgi:hypothetical protein